MLVRRLRLRACLLLRAVEARVVDGHRHASPELLREGEVLVVVAAPALTPDERERAEHPAARAQRHDQRGAEPDLARPPDVLVVAARPLEQLLRDLRVQLGLPGPDDGPDPA